MEYSFVKYHGSGNDMIIFDDRKGHFPECTKELVQKLCDRKYGIGADGLILLREKEENFEMHFYNPDGSCVEMCGNGMRSLAHYIDSLGIKKEKYKILSGKGTYFCRILENGVAVEMDNVHTIASPFLFDDQPYRGHFISVGVPHIIIPVADLETIDVEGIGRALRHHHSLAPGGANISFISILDEVVKIRTYERGVEGETLCCGTAAVAAGFVANKIYKCKAPVSVLPVSGEKIFINIETIQKKEKIEMIGNAVRTFSGNINIS